LFFDKAVKQYGTADQSSNYGEMIQQQMNMSGVHC